MLAANRTLLSRLDVTRDVLVEQQALLADKKKLAHLKMPDPLGGGRMHNGIEALALFKEKVSGEKVIEGWVEGPLAEAADLRGINTVMMEIRR